MPKPSIHHGVVVVDKPKGPTSHDVVARVRKAFATREVGHAGTLDPMATGVLVIAVGEATKLVPYLTAADKAYEATVSLGTSTDTLDAEGAVTATAPVPALDDATVRAALATERARTAQVPPVYSAIRLDGERAHRLARRGEAPVLEPRPVAVRSLELVGRGSAELLVALEVAKGYFVRSLARDLAEALGTVGHLTALRRTRSGTFDLANAIALDALSPAALVPLATAAAKALPVTVLTEEGVRAAGFGQPIPRAMMNRADAGVVAFLDEAGVLVAIGEVGADGRGRVLRGFSGSRLRDG